METIATLTGILVLAALAEALVEYLANPIIEALNLGEWHTLALRYTAALAGVLLCMSYRADLLVFFHLTAPWPWVGYAITGLLVGRGSNYVHDFASTWLNAD